MFVSRETLQKGTAAFSVSLTPEMEERFETYARLLVEWNQKINLTAILEPEAIAVKHFVDSLAPFAFFQPEKGARCLDIGTGAGFPAIPFLIVRPDLHMTMLDSTNKKLLFLQDVLCNLGLQAETLHARAEEAGQQPFLREQFDLVTARAVASLRELSEYCLPFVRPGGVFLALKGPEWELELEQAQTAVSLLGGKLEMAKSFILPDRSSRSVLLFKKISQSPAKYPRPSAQIARKPL